MLADTMQPRRHRRGYTDRCFLAAPRTNPNAAPAVPATELLSGFDAGKGQIDRVPPYPVCPP